jgi:anti-sigma factor ChrR (cupin superfamily)
MSGPSELTDELRELAASYALGVLDAPEVAEFERLLAANPACLREVQAFQEVATGLAHGAPLARPPARLKENLMRRIALPAEDAQASGAAKFFGLVLRAGEGRWIQTPFPGVEIKRLFKDPVTGAITTLLKAAAGAVYPAHEHGGLEQVFVIDGDMIFDDHTLDTGDYEVSAGETRHSAIRTTEGCLALIIHSPKDRILPS